MTTLTGDLKITDDQQPMIIHPAFFGPNSDSTTNLIGDQLDFVDDESQSGKSCIIELLVPDKVPDMRWQILHKRAPIQMEDQGVSDEKGQNFVIFEHRVKVTILSRIKY